MVAPRSRRHQALPHQAAFAALPGQAPPGPLTADRIGPALPSLAVTDLYDLNPNVCDAAQSAATQVHGDPHPVSSVAPDARRRRRTTRQPSQPQEPLSRATPPMRVQPTSSTRQPPRGTKRQWYQSTATTPRPVPSRPESDSGASAALLRWTPKDSVAQAGPPTQAGPSAVVESHAPRPPPSGTLGQQHLRPMLRHLAPLADAEEAVTTPALPPAKSQPTSLDHPPKTPCPLPRVFQTAEELRDLRLHPSQLVCRTDAAPVEPSSVHCDTPRVL